MAVPVGIMAASLGLDALGLGIGAHSQSRANATNLKISRETRAWEEMMSNTAVQRRRRDIERAGGNPALAFTGGQEATTPSVQPAHMEPTVRGSDFNFTGKAMNILQAKQSLAQTQNIEEQTRGLRIRNNVSNAFAMNIAAVNYDIAEIKKQNESLNYDLLGKQIENAIKTGENLTLTGAQTAAELARFNRMTDSVVKLIQQQVRAGQIDLDALENLATVGGVEAGKASGIIKTAIDALRVFFQNRK